MTDPNASPEGGSMQEALRGLMQKLSLRAGGNNSNSGKGGEGEGVASSSSSSSPSSTAAAGGKPQAAYQFWNTQPVLRLDESVSGGAGEGAIEGDAPREKVRADPLPLNALFRWAQVDLADAAQLREVYTLLTHNYVEDDDAMFRFDYSAEFIRWALQPPGHVPDWHVGVRARDSGKLVAFIGGIPVALRLADKSKNMAEINFLCVHKKLRAKRLAPLLIREITRRIHLTGRFQAVYTAGVVLPKPVATCRYWHRSLDAKKLIEARFSALPKGWTLARTIRHYALPEETATPHLRAMEARDVRAVANLLNAFLARHTLLHPQFSAAEAAHWLLPVRDVVYSFVAQDPRSGVVTDFVSFYNLPSSVIDNPKHSEIRAAYLFYYAVREENGAAAAEPHEREEQQRARLRRLLTDALVLARKEKFDAFNCLNLMRSDEELLRELKFGMGDGQLRYYLFNWKMRDLQPRDIGLVML